MPKGELTSSVAAANVLVVLQNSGQLIEPEEPVIAFCLGSALASILLLELYKYACINCRIDLLSGRASLCLRSLAIFECTILWPTFWKAHPSLLCQVERNIPSEDSNCLALPNPIIIMRNMPTSYCSFLPASP